MLGDQTNQIAPYLDSEESILLSTIDPKWESHQAKREAAHQDIAYEDWRSQVKSGTVDTGLPIVHNEAGNVSLVNGTMGIRDGDGVGSGEASGGFAFAALLPMLAPLIGPAISGITSIFSSLFRKKDPEPQGPAMPPAGYDPDFEIFKRMQARKRQMAEDQMIDDRIREEQGYAPSRRSRYSQQDDRPTAEDIAPDQEIASRYDPHSAARSKGRSRGRGLVAPNGRGVMPANYRIHGAGDMQQFLESYIPEMRQDEEHIMAQPGHKLYRGLFKHGHRHISNLMQAAGHDPSMADKIGQAVINRAFPMSFQKFVQDKAGDTAHGSGAFGGMVGPMSTWGLKKLLPKANIDELRKAVNMEVMKLNPAEGSGPIWEKVKRGAKIVMNKILPGMAKISKDGIPKLVDAIMNKFNLDPSKYGMVAEAIKGISKSIPDKIEGDVFDVSKEPDDSEAPKDKPKGKMTRAEALEKARKAKMDKKVSRTPAIKTKDSAVEREPSSLAKSRSKKYATGNGVAVRVKML